MNFLDVLITFPQYLTRKVGGQDRRICSLILGFKGLTQSYVDIVSVHVADVLIVVFSAKNRAREKRRTTETTGN